MGSDAKMQLKVLRDVLGKRRYRVAVLRFGQKLEPADIARRLGVSRKTVWQDLGAVNAVRNEIARHMERERLRRSKHIDDRIAAYAMN